MIDYISNLSSIEIVALTIYGESRGESIAGQIAVGCVIRNRAISRHKTYEEICLEPKQFSCWNEGDPNRILLDDIGERLVNGQMDFDRFFEQDLWIASGIIEGKIIDNVNGAMNYLTFELFNSGNVPSWARSAKNLRTIGSQVFFTV